jgi:mRNA-degrading endonuclease HigB of HigAB toxin-antitoxin module
MKIPKVLTKKTFTMIIETTPNAYGFGQDWTLVVKKKSFYLGQDIKFCQRVLGMHPSYVAENIGTNDLRSDSARRKLARFIVQSLGIDDFENLQAWELCCQ